MMDFVTEVEEGVGRDSSGPKFVNEVKGSSIVRVEMVTRPK